jgi:hypothetical protein
MMLVIWYRLTCEPCPSVFIGMLPAPAETGYRSYRQAGRQHPGSEPTRHAPLTHKQLLSVSSRAADRVRDACAAVQTR